MSYDGEYDASEYPDGVHAPRLGYRGAREMTELRESKDREVQHWRDRALAAEASLERLKALADALLPDGRD